MQQTIKILVTVSIAMVVAACGKADVDEPAPSVQPAVLSSDAEVTIDYRIIGKPVVGQPVAIELTIASSRVNQPLTVNYRIMDATAMRLADTQPDTLSLAPADDRGSAHQVTVIPMREGRVYLNVSVNIESGNGSMGTVTAIPLQVSE